MHFLLGLHASAKRKKVRCFSRRTLLFAACLSQSVRPVEGSSMAGASSALPAEPRGHRPLGSCPPPALLSRGAKSVLPGPALCSFPLAPGRPESASRRFQGPVVRSPSPLPGGVSAAAVTGQLPAPPCPRTMQPGGISAVLTPPPATGARPLCSKTRALHCPASWVLPNKSPNLGDLLSQFVTRCQNR